jgi:signal peptidase I
MIGIKKSLFDRRSKGFLFVHAGHSMDPILIGNDLLEVLRYDCMPINEGDIVVFFSPIDATIIAHRVSSIMPYGIRTRGDNNNYVDDWYLSSSAIIGKVISATRNNKRIEVHGGSRGLLYAKLSLAKVKLNYKCIQMLYHVLRPISREKIFLPFSKVVKPKVTIFQVGNEKRFFLLMGRRIIGIYNSCDGRWRIRTFYRLFIDPRDLPNVNDIENIK